MVAAAVVLKTANHATTPQHAKPAAANTISRQVSATTVRPIWLIAITL